MYDRRDGLEENGDAPGFNKASAMSQGMPFPEPVTALPATIVARMKNVSAEKISHALEACSASYEFSITCT